MDISLLGATLALLAALTALCILPQRADSSEDTGDGRAVVQIPRPVPTSRHRPRTWAFLAISAALGLVFVGLRRPSLPDLYAAAVRAVAVAITRDPASVNGYIARLRPATLFLAVAYIAGISLVCRAGLGRRLAMLAHAPLYLAMSLLTHALMIVAGVATGWLVAPFGIEATLVNLLIGGIVVTRMTVTGFIMPRGTTVPRTRPRWAWDSVLAGCAVACALALIVCTYAFTSTLSGVTGAWQLFLPLYAVSLLFAAMFAPLCLLWWVSPRLPAPGRSRPAVDVIVPAYNEAENVSRLLASIDVAAARYGGPVHVIVSNDGSRDDTAPLAAAAIGRFAHATGQVLTAPNGGQSMALNRALALTRAGIVVRIDADCVMGPDALVYSAPWFADPVIGSVGAMEEPRTDNVTWFHRLRALEALFQFRFARLGQSLVDGVVVIPGTFTAFRRQAAMAIGGYPVGMNGEDNDLTMQLGRMGLRSVIDPRIRCYEDVPASAAEFVEQRTRWARGGFHTYAKHQPIRNGTAGPRVWLWTVRRSFSWFSLQAGMVAPIFMAELALTNPGYRSSAGVLALLYLAGGALPLVVALPLAVRHRQWRSIAWAPTWFAFAYLRRLGTQEAAISLPTRPFPARRIVRESQRTAGLPVPDLARSRW
ncbi:MAG TPA: glycosyltransferase family 2 protein [Streptosporangiaceae bacterium]|nr:glycosyltransferase family 2 protein [Streptosporangiaceae bacterium]